MTQTPNLYVLAGLGLLALLAAGALGYTLALAVGRMQDEEDEPEGFADLYDAMYDVLRRSDIGCFNDFNGVSEDVMKALASDLALAAVQVPALADSDENPMRAVTVRGWEATAELTARQLLKEGTSTHTAFVRLLGELLDQREGKA